ncbi:MAG: phosphoribosylformylglycinamidine synthase, partial [Nitrospinota bacterium]
PFGTGKGCRLIFNTDVLCFAPPDYARPLPPKLLHPKRVLKGVHRGIRDGANQSGIPDVNGAILFDERFLGKPLVFCGTGGLMPREIRGEPAHLKRADPGDWIVMVGGRIGKDGIHGATFSSLELREDSPSTAVQIGDPITQKKMFDFLLEARDRGYYKCITDNGAGGLSSSVGEMARFSNGCELHLEKAPLKYVGLQPWEILLSEAQERMTLAVAPDKLEAFLALAAQREVEATPLGRFTDSGKFHVLYQGKTVAYLDMDFLHQGLPRLHLQARWTPPRHPEPNLPEPEDCTPLLLRLLSSLNICSKESLVRQYDHEVQGMSVIKPFVGVENDGPSDAAVLRPFFDSYEGIIVANGICPRYSDIDTYHMVACAIDEAVRNVLAVGGKLGHIAGLDNFCWPDPIESEKTPDGRYKLAQLVRANQALYDYCTAYDLPCISGKDSMKNDYHIGTEKISVPPTLLFSVLARMEDVRRAVTMDAKQAGDLVYVLGETRAELGGSEYYALYGWIGNRVPTVDASRAKTLYQALAQATGRGLVASCHDCSEGGLGVALAETAFAGGLGMEISLAAVPRSPEVDRDDTLLFSESQSRFVVTVHPEHQEEFEALFAHLPCGRIGVVTASPLFTVRGRRGTTIIQSDIFRLKAAWQQPLQRY